MVPINDFIDPHTYSAVSRTNKLANQHWDGCAPSSGGITKKLTVCQGRVLAHYIVVSEIADTLVFVLDRLDPSRKDNKVTLYY